MTPLFICGTGRCGTTVMRQVLQTNPYVVSANRELRFISDPNGLLDLLENLLEPKDPYYVDNSVMQFRKLFRSATGYHSQGLALLSKIFRRAFISLNLPHPKYLGLNLANDFGVSALNNAVISLITDLGVSSVEGGWIGSGQYPSFKSRFFFLTADLSEQDVQLAANRFVISLFRGLQPQAGRLVAKYWLDDTPYSSCHMTRILRVFPSAKFLIMNRNKAKVEASYSKFYWGPASETTVSQVELAQARQLEGLKPNQGRIVNFEELISSPRSTLSSVAEFLSVPDDFDASIINRGAVSNYPG